MFILVGAWQLFQFYFAFLLLVAVHEAGHQFAGALVGYRWKGWIVGPLEVARDDGPVRVGLSKTLLSGQASAFPYPDDTRARQAIYTAGGPAASFLLGLGLILYFLRLSPAQKDGAGQVILLLVFMSGLLVLASIIPYSHKDFKNDAARLVQLWKEKDKWAAYEEKKARYEEKKARYDGEMARNDALVTLAGSMQAGQRPRDWDSCLVEQANVLRDGEASEATAAHPGFYWAADLGDWEKCGDYIARALALRGTLSEVFQAMVLLDGAYYAGLTRGDAATARRLLAVASGITGSDDETQATLRSMTLRAEAAALRAEGKPQEAVQKAQEALASLSLVASGGCADRALIERLVA